MSSSFHISMQRALEKIGVVKGTNDKTFDSHVETLSKLGSFAETCKEHIVHYLSCVTVMARSAHTLSDDFKSFYEKDPDYPFTTVALKHESETLKLKQETMEKLQTHVSTRVLQRTDLWLDYLYNLQRRVAAREESRLKFDHYTRKILDLRTAYDKTVAKGKPEAPKDKDRRERNEKKYDDAKLEYETLNKQVSDELLQAWDQRFLWYNPIMSEMVKTQIFITDTISKTHALTMPALKAAVVEIPHVAGDADPITAYTKLKEEREAAEKKKLEEEQKEKASQGFFSSLFGRSRSASTPAALTPATTAASASSSETIPEETPEVPAPKPKASAKAAPPAAQAPDTYDEEEEPRPAPAPRSKNGKKAVPVAAAEDVFEEPHQQHDAALVDEDGFEFDAPPAAAPARAAAPRARAASAAVSEQKPRSKTAAAPAPIAAPARRAPPPPLQDEEAFDDPFAGGAAPAQDEWDFAPGDQPAVAPRAAAAPPKKSSSALAKPQSSRARKPEPASPFVDTDAEAVAPAPARAAPSPFVDPFAEMNDQPASAAAPAPARYSAPPSQPGGSSNNPFDDMF